jgi:hypothetical protein
MHSWNWKRYFKDSNRRYGYARGFVALAEIHDMFRIRSIFTGGN